MDSAGVDVRPLREANGGYLFNKVFLTTCSFPTRGSSAPPVTAAAARTTLGNERVNIATGGGQPPGCRPAAGRPRRPGPGRGAGRGGRAAASALAFTAMSQRLLLRQIAGLAGPARRACSRYVSAENVASVRRAVVDWHGADSAVLAGPAHGYLSVPRSSSAAAPWKSS